VDWLGLNQAALDAEALEGGHGRRIVKVMHPDAAQDVWIGTFGSAAIEAGPAAYQFSDGEVVTV
jgi:hypothetical protein